MDWLAHFFQDAHNWISIALALFIGVMVRLKVPGLIAKSLDDAGAKVQAQLDEAKRLREEAETLLAQIKVQAAETETMAANMLQNAQVDAERMRAEAAVALEADIVRRRDLAMRKIATAEAQATGEVKSAAAEMAAQVAEKILTARLAVAKSDPLIDGALVGLGQRFS